MRIDQYNGEPDRYRVVTSCMARLAGIVQTIVEGRGWLVPRRYQRCGEAGLNCAATGDVARLTGTAQKLVAWLGWLERIDTSGVTKLAGSA